MAYLQLGVDPSRTGDGVDKSYVDGGTSSLLPTSTWDSWLISEWDTVLGWFGSPVPGTDTNTTVWTNIVSNIVNPLNVIETQANKVIVHVGTDLTNIFSGIFGTTTPTSSTKITSGSVANVLGGSDLGADVSSVNTTTTSHNTWFTQILTSLGLGGGSGTGTNIGGAISSAASTASSASSAASTNTTNLSNTWNWVFGTTTPTSSSLVQTNKLSNIFGGSTLSADLTNLATALYGTTSVTSTTKALPTSIANVLGGASLGDDVSSVSTTTTSHNTWFTQILTALGLSGGSGTGTNIGGAISTAQSTATSASSTASSASSAASTNTTNLTNTWSWLFATTTPTSSTPVQSSKVANVLGGSSLGADLTALGNALFGSPTVASTISTAAVPSGISATKIANVLGGADLGTDVTNVVDQLFGITTTPTSINQVLPTTLPGVQGITDIITTVQNTWDGMATAISNALGLTGVASSNNQLSTITSVVSAHAQATSTALTQAQASVNAVSGITGGSPSSMTLTGAALSNMSLYNVTSTVNLTSSLVSEIGFIRCPIATTYGQVTFAVFKQGTGTPVLFVNFYKLDPSTSTLHWLFSSPNIATSLTTSLGWITYTFPGPDAISVNPGDVIAVEIQSTTVSGTVSVNVATSGVPALPSSRTSAAQKSLGATRSSPGTSAPTGDITTSGYNWSVQAPYVALEITNFPADYEPPITFAYLTSQSVTPPAWANFVDVIAVGGGGGGGDSSAGSAGGSTVVTVGGSTVTATGGAGGASGVTGTASDGYGRAPAAEMYSGVSYPGGSQVYLATPGNPPGGGGGGGYNSGLYAHGGVGGNWNASTFSLAGISSIGIAIGAAGATGGAFGSQIGAPGGAWLVFRQS